jgi:hypothetical protein
MSKYQNVKVSKEGLDFWSDWLLNTKFQKGSFAPILPVDSDDRETVIEG